MKKTKPKVSLIFPVYGQCKLLLNALGTLKEVTRYPNYEVVLVDDRSEENMDEVYDKEYLYDTLIRLPQRTGNSTVGVNEGVKAASGDFIQYQNTDVYFEDPGWLDKVVDAFDGNTAVVGPALLYPDRTVQSAGMFFDRRGLNRHLYRYKLYETVDKRTLDVPMVTGCGLTTRKDVYDELGGFRVFRPHGWDDAEWCLRVRRSGYGVKLCPDSYFFHLGTVSYSGMDDPQYHSNRRKIFREYKHLLKELSRFKLDRQKHVFFLRDLQPSSANLTLIDLMQRCDLNGRSELLVVPSDSGELKAVFQKCGARIFPSPLVKSAASISKTVARVTRVYECFSFLQSEKPDVVVYDNSFARLFSVVRALSKLVNNSASYMELGSFENRVGHAAEGSVSQC